MKSANYLGKRVCQSEAGFSFIEIAIALIIVGLLAGAGFLLLGKTLDSIQRKETVQRLQEAKKALLLYAENQGKLPATADTLYYQKIGSSPIDAWKQPISYKASANVSATFLPALCGKLKSPSTTTGWLALNDVEINSQDYTVGGTGDKAIVALLLSGGARDADPVADDKLLDGGNAAVSGPFVRKYPTESFDDIVMAITAADLYGAIKENFCTATVEVTDTRVSEPLGGIYYIYNNSIDPLKPIGSANQGNSVKVLALMGETIQIKNTTATLNFTVGSNPTRFTSAVVTDTRVLPPPPPLPALPAPPINPIMTVKIVDPP